MSTVSGPRKRRRGIRPFRQPEIRLLLKTPHLVAGLAWVAGTAASGAKIGRGKDLLEMLLAVLLIGTVWGRLVDLCEPAPHSAPRRSRRLRRSSESTLRFLPYTQPGSLSALLSCTLYDTLSRARTTLTQSANAPIEAAWLLGVLLLISALLGRPTLIAFFAGLGLLGLLRLASRYPGTRPFLAGIALFAWPWWSGHVAHLPLSPISLAFGILWGLAGSAWLCLQDGKPHSRIAVHLLLPQVGLALLLLPSHPLAGALLTFLLLGQTLPLTRGDPDSLTETLPCALSLRIASAILLSGLAVGGWLY
ncbi:MAG: hypothetical protein ACP5SI_01755 [Chloroflexia bacterium]